jgi:biopolymer transport protein ExbD
MLRHRGSPQHVAGLTFATVVEALRDGSFDVTDEIRGPSDAAWTVIEEHPRLAEIAEDLTAGQAPVEEDEGHIDMNALIDVTLVLLIFFILTTGYQVLEKVLEMPRVKASSDSGVRNVTAQQVDSFMIRVKARQEQGTPKIWIGDQAVSEADLEQQLRMQAGQNRKELILDAADVEYGTVIKIIDAAGGAGIDKVHFLVSKGNKN